MNSLQYDQSKLYACRYPQYTLDTIPLLQKLRKELVNTRAEVCIERSRYITDYFMNMSSDSDDPQIRFAKAMNYFLSHKEAVFFDENLLAGSTTSKRFGAPVYPEFGTGLSIWPELDTISKRSENPLILNEKEADELNFNIYPYWMDRSLLEYTRHKYNDPLCMQLFEQLIFYISGKAGCISHTVPYYSWVLDNGIESIIARASGKEAELKKIPDRTVEQERSLKFYQAVQVAMQGVIAYATNLSTKASELAHAEKDPSIKENYQKMAEVCAQVPAKPARTLREAINAIWIMQVAIHAENINMAMSPGRLDQILYKFYVKDKQDGKISDQEAIELIGCLWLKLNDNTNLVPEASEKLFGGAGTVPAVTLGGVNQEGKDAVNDLTYIMLKVTELLKIRDPNVNARYNYNVNDKTYRHRVAEVIVNTEAVPAMYNDIASFETLKKQSYTDEHAHDMAVIGCVELASGGRSYDASSSIILNLASVLELTLYNGKHPTSGNEQIGPETGNPEQFKTFEEFWEAIKTQARWLIGQAIELNEYFGHVYQERQFSSILSSFFEGPLDKGQDLIFGSAIYNSSGATHIAFADVVDSLTAIEKAVFIEKKCSFGELLLALKHDFKGHETLHQYLLHKVPKYGTDDPLSLKNSQNVVKFLFDFYQSHVNYRGGKYRPAYWTMTNHSGQGSLVGALPNGRKAGKTFASGITPVSQEILSLSTCLRSVAALDAEYLPGGEALNLKFPSLVTEEDIEKFAQTIEAYFVEGGLQVQFNIMSYDKLIDAWKNPDKYPDLLVRVSGYSAYFKDLNDIMKQEIITRTEYNIKTGTMDPFPEEYKYLLPFN